MSEPCKPSVAKNSQQENKYHTVVIDPPWHVQNGFTNEKFVPYGRALPYQTLTDKQILSFPIDDFADEECDLFIWTTQTKLPIALKILPAWGFKYHALLTWDKKSGVAMMGFYHRTEMVVYGYRGRFGVLISEGHYIPTLFSQTATHHSEKPSLFYELIRNRTREPRIDIFARKRHYGFDAYGDPVEHGIDVPLEHGFGGAFATEPSGSTSKSPIGS